MNILDLNRMSFTELRTWLFDALNGRASVPRVSPDEPPDVAILAHEHTLDKPTRRDLSRACRDLVVGFIDTGEGSVSYTDALLRLATGLKLSELATPLAEMASHFRDLPGVALEIKQAILLALIDLKEHQEPSFWEGMLKQDAAFAGPALSGLLARNWRAGVAILDRLPDDPMFGSVVHVIFEQALEDLLPKERSACLLTLQAVSQQCVPALRDALESLLREYDVESVPASTHSPRRINRLQDAFRSFAARFPSVKSLVGEPSTARLIAA